MSGPDHDQHDAAWRERMAALGEPAPGTPATQDQTVEALKAQALLHSRGRGGNLVRILLPLAAAVLFFLAGHWWGRRSDETAQTLPRFALLLLEDSTFQGAQVGHDSLVAEYTAWAGQLAGGGNLILGEELDEASYQLGTASVPATGQMTGLFVIAARNLETALALARSCPHLKYGGGIVVRPVAAT